MPFCVRLMSETATHEGAKARCNQLDGYLAIVNDVHLNSLNRSLAENGLWCNNNNNISDNNNNISGNNNNINNKSTASLLLPLLQLQ